MTSVPGRIVITGTFCSLNKGDAAMRIALADALHKAIPGCHVTMMTPYPELDGGAYRSDAVVGCSRRKAGRVIGMLLRAICWNIIHRISRTDAQRILDSELKVYRQSDVVVDLSGDGITEEYGIKCLISHLVPLVLGKLLCRPVFVCAQTIGPLRKTCRISRYILRKADAVTARESLTHEYLSRMGLNGTLSPTADMAFLMEPASVERAKEVLAQEEVPRDRPLIGISVSQLPGHIFGCEGDGKPSRLEIELSDTLDRMIASGFRPVFISHTTGPGQRRDDRRAASRVAQLTCSRNDVTVLQGDYSAEETKAVIGQMELFVGIRMHSCIAAMSMEVPTICIAYGPKAYGIMELAGQGDWIVDIREVTADRLFDLVQDVWSRRIDLRASLKANMWRVFDMSRSNVRIVEQLLKTGPGARDQGLWARLARHLEPS